MKRPPQIKLLLIILPLFALARPAWPASWNEAKAAYAAGHFSEAVKLAEPVAAQGDARAETMLGFLYLEGKGCKRDYAKALKWTRQAAEFGMSEAQVRLATMYYKGDGVKQDISEATKWYTKAAEQGDVYSLVRLGIISEQDPGDKNIEKAVNYYQKAADKGSLFAMWSLASLYEEGAKLPKDDARAFEWNKKAAEAGLISSMGKVGSSYLEGRGTQQDIKSGVNWTKRAAEKGNARAQTVMGMLYQRAIEIPAAQELDAFVEHSGPVALEWYTKAAKGGNALAQLKLCAQYANGQGIPKDYEGSYLWCTIAAANHDSLSQPFSNSSDQTSMGDLAVKLRDAMERQLTKTQIVEVQKRAKKVWASIKQAEDAQNKAEAEFLGDNAAAAGKNNPR